jgi:hypothetical protein
MYYYGVAARGWRSLAFIRIHFHNQAMLGMADIWDGLE